MPVPPPPGLPREHVLRWKRRLTTALTTLTGIVALLPTAIAQAATSVGSWMVQDTTTINSLSQGQGLATVTASDGSTSLWFTGLGSIPSATYSAGWTHVGDPDSIQGYTVEPYEGSSSATAKMFRVWSPSG